MQDLIGQKAKSKKTGRVGVIMGYDPGTHRVDAMPGVMPGQPFIILRTSEPDLERLHKNDFIPEQRTTSGE